RLSSRARLGGALLLRRRLRPVLLQKRLKQHDDQERQRKDDQQPALHPGFLLRIVKFCQISSSSFLRQSFPITALLSDANSFRRFRGRVPHSSGFCANEWH